MEPKISLAYLLAEELRQNTGSFKFNIFELGDLLRYKPLQTRRAGMLAASECRC